MSSPTFESSQGRSAVPTAASPCFLTPVQSSAWLAARGIAEAPAPDAPGTHFFQFAPRPIFVSFRELFRAMLAHAGPFQGGLLKFCRWHWEGGCECDPTASYRRGRGDSRPLRQVPAFLFGADESMDVADLLALAVERQWSASFYAASRSTTLMLRNGSQVDVFSSGLGIERRIQHLLVGLGAVLFIP